MTKVSGPILTRLPDFDFKDLKTAQTLRSDSFLNSSSNGLFVHFWGTWCAPCAVEFPQLLKFAGSLEGSSVKFLLIAINDQKSDLEKFLKKYGTLPSNISIGMDDGGSMDLFGTSKVPETYLFDSGKNLVNKFIGPQNWEDVHFLERTKKDLKI